MHISLKAAIAGASGYARGEVACLLAAHLEIEVTTLTAASSAGRFFGELHPRIGSLAKFEIQETFVETLSGHDLVILALPRGRPAALAEELDASGDGAPVLDCAADHRLIKAEDWAEYYRGEFSPAWTYGTLKLIRVREPLARVQREFLTAAHRITVPGCNVTAAALALRPAVHVGLADVLHTVTTPTVGYSGVGKPMKPHLLASQALGSMAPYAVGGTRRHIPKIVQNFVLVGGDKESMRPSFIPVLVPTSHGILATVAVPLVEGVREENVKEAYTIYEDEVFITVTSDGVWPTSEPVTSIDFARAEVVVDAKTGTFITIAVIDNLGKGTVAAAVQSTNIALGLEEYLGVSMIGVAP